MEIEVCEALNLDDKKCKLLERLLPKLCKTVRKKRALSERNMYLSKCVRARGSGVPVTEAFKKCSDEFKEGKR